MGRRTRDRERGQASTPPAQKGSQAPPPVPAGGLTFTPWTWGFGLAGIVAALAGFFLLAQGSMTLAPILLVLGFLVFFPIALSK